MAKASKEEQRKAPILRFKGFTDDWEQRKLGEVSKKLKSYSLTRSVESRTKTQIKYVHYGDIHTGIAQNITINNKLPWIKLDQSKEIEKLKRGDIIVADASEDYKGIADAALIEESLPYNIIAGLHTIAFRPNNQLMDSKFIFYSLQNINFKRYGYKIGTGLKVFGISANNFFNFNLKFPNILEQNKISTIINKLKNLLALYEMKKQLLAQLKQGIVNFLITKNRQKPQLRFSGFNNNWESKSFEKLLNYEQPTKYIVKKADYISQGTPVLTANKSFILGYTNETNVYQNIPAIIFDDFTLESKYVDFPFMVKSSAIKILTSKNLNLFFIYQLLNNQRFVQEGHSRHYISVVQKKKVLVPSIQEQNKIGNLIKQLENNIEQNSDTFALLKSLKEFLLQSMFL